VIRSAVVPTVSWLALSPGLVMVDPYEVSAASFMVSL